MRTTITLTRILAVLLLCSVALAQDKPREPSQPFVLPGARVEIVTSDGVKLVGTYSKASQSTRTVILLPMIGNPRDSYVPLAEALHGRGIGVLALDLRGQGDSTGTVDGKTLSFATFKDGPSGDWAKLSGDIECAANWLEHHGVARQCLAVVGSSISANAALVFASQHPEIPQIVLLSPGGEYRGIGALEPASKVKNAVLLMCHSTDPYSADSCSTISAILKQSGATLTSERPLGRMHGTTMLDRFSIPHVVNWIETGEY